MNLFNQCGCDCVACCRSLWGQFLPSSTTSPTNTLAIPAIAITTLWDTLVLVMDCINWRKKIKKREVNLIFLYGFHSKSNLLQQIYPSDQRGYTHIMKCTIVYTCINTLQRLNNLLCNIDKVNSYIKYQ